MMRKDRSQSTKVVFRRTPTGRTSHICKNEKNAKPLCRACGRVLGGVKEKGAKSEKAPTRKFGGELCVRCVSEIVKARARIATGAATIGDYNLSQRKYINRESTPKAKVVVAKLAKNAKAKSRVSKR